jgi:diguanylate cyclase
MSFDFTTVNLPVPVALAAVAVIGYLIGRRQIPGTTSPDGESRREMKRAHLIAKDLEKIAKTVRKSLARHHASVARFKGRVSELSDHHNEAAWKELCKEAEDILGPTMELATQMAAAYDEIRQQSHQLMTFTEVRTDPLTGVSNRRAMDDTLRQLLAMKNRYELIFSIVIFDIDFFKKINDERGHLAGDQVLQSVARLLDDTARETDIVTRYGGEEFVILMPHTDMHGACIFSERVRILIEQQLALTVSGGIAAAIHGETPQRMLERADAALYHAKTSGRNQISLHNGETLESVRTELENADTAAEESVVEQA